VGGTHQKKTTKEGRKSKNPRKDRSNLRNDKREETVRAEGRKAWEKKEQGNKPDGAS